MPKLIGLKTEYCKQGHKRDPLKAGCVECRREQERRRYKNNTEWREKKKAKVRAYKRKFRDDNGFWQAKLYARDKKTEGGAATTG